MSDPAAASAAAPHRSRARLGALLGVTAGPSAGFGASYSGIGDGGPSTWLFAIAFAALLGAICWPVFAADAGLAGRPGVGFSALFGFAVGLLAGALAAFPVGSVMGAFGGALGAAAAAAALRLRRRLGARAVTLAALTLGAGLPLLVLWGWTR
ncbi:MAG: hypothetical protein CSA66_02400 [Proteobacteria bacterium]|nr:MAG: hypothetical protein CSA66_02400 [Pseudomonadota bacterium]